MTDHTTGTSAVPVGLLPECEEISENRLHQIACKRVSRPANSRVRVKNAGIDKDAKAERNRKIFDLWMQCYTQQEIAGVVGIDQGDLSKMAKGFMEIGNLAKNHISAAEHATDFTVPIYNVWRRQ